MDLGLDGSVALVTGGSAGLGLASAAALAREGANVAVCARNAARLETARDRIETIASGSVLSVQADLTDDQGDLEELVDEVTESFGGIDHLVVSTGGPRPAPFVETRDRDWYVTYDLLAMSVVRLARLTVPALAKSGGSITVVACSDAREAVAGTVLSSAIHRIAVGLVESLAVELAPEVRANAVLAGPHDTAYFEALVRQAVDRGRFESYEAAVDEITSALPRGKLGDPDDLGDVVAFLAGDPACSLTGAAVPVGGSLRLD